MSPIVFQSVRLCEEFIRNLGSYLSGTLQICSQAQTGIRYQSIRSNRAYCPSLKTINVLSNPGSLITKTTTPWLILPKGKLFCLFYDVKS
jgi:hypothetical protein